MKRQFKWDKKYLYWGITAFCVIAAGLVFYKILEALPAFRAFLRNFVKIISPFLWGFAFAYLLAPLMRLLEKKVLNPIAVKLSRKKDSSAHPSRAVRYIAVLVSEIVLIVILASLIYMIMPQLYSTINMIFDNIPKYFETMEGWIGRLFKNYPEIESYVNQALDTVQKQVQTWVQDVLIPRIGTILTNVGSGVYIALKGVYNLILGIVISVYILGDLETFTAGAKRILYSLFSLEKASSIRKALHFADHTFQGFLVGKVIDSAIVGVLCYICCLLFRIPYPLLVSALVGVTNIIPFFGPLIGAVPSALIILMVSPVKCLIFIIMIIVLQQLDGNVIGPKILGNKIGINGFWVMFSIVVGAGLFGFWGMLLGVPVFVLIYSVVDTAINNKLAKEHLPVGNESYKVIERIDPETKEVVYMADEKKRPEE
ncbi:MAG: AI-2E family transporter [Firmicutes bacterium]|nr:AI-2E family transporter [Bacillota bacterium]